MSSSGQLASIQNGLKCLQAPHTLVGVSVQFTRTSSSTGWRHRGEGVAAADIGCDQREARQHGKNQRPESKLVAPTLPLLFVCTHTPTLGNERQPPNCSLIWAKQIVLKTISCIKWCAQSAVPIGTRSGPCSTTEHFFG